MTERPMTNSPTDAAISSETMQGFTRVPGLLRRWELPQVVQPGVEFVVEGAGRLDGVELYRVFQRPPATADAAQTDEADDDGIAVGLLLEGESAPLPARLVPLGAEHPLMAVVALDGRRNDASTLLRVRQHLEKALSSKASAGSHSVAATARASMRAQG